MSFKINVHLLLKNTVTRLSLIILVLLDISSCSKFVDVSAPSTQIVSSEVFRDSMSAESAVTGLYGQITANTGGYFCDGGFSLFTGLTGDELKRTSSSANYDEFYNNAISTTNNYNTTYLWKFAYSFIYEVNACIEGLNASNNLSNAYKKQLIGEMYCMRGLLYFYMVNLYGAVPLETSTNYKVNAVMPRTTEDSIYTQIITDLANAKDLLPEAYISSDRTRPNKWTATALLARTYLYRKQWQKAIDEATSVINSGIYSLESLGNVFLATSNETIFQMYPGNDYYNTAEGLMFNPSSTTAKPTYVLANSLVAQFASNDLRKSNWTSTRTVSGISYTYTYKWKVRSGTTKTEYNIVFRLAELLLIRAEANAELGNNNASITDINSVRARAGLDEFPAGNSTTDILSEIMKERQLELFSEWGHRWFDLKRTGTIDAVLSVEKSTWNATDSVFPIPYNELNNNPFLIQNTGY